MIKFEHECCDCKVPGYPCRGSLCDFGSTHFFCDECKDEVDELYEYENEQLCESCLLGKFPKASEM